MDRDGDFSAYASARWGGLVRSAVFLGCSLDEAHDLVTTTLTRCYTAWRMVQKADNRDAYVYRMLLNCHRDSRRRRWWGEQPTATRPDQPSGVDPVVNQQTCPPNASCLSGIGGTTPEAGSVVGAGSTVALNVM